MEESEDGSRKRKGKFRSSRRKKRKGFHGKKAWEIRREIEGESDVGSHVESNKTQPSTSDAPSEGKEMSNVFTPKNMSELKLMNSSFEELRIEKEL